MSAEPNATAAFSDLAALQAVLASAERRAVAQGRMLAEVAATPAIAGGDRTRGGATALLALAAALIVLL